MAAFDGKAMAAEVCKSIRSYTDRRVGTLTKFATFHSDEIRSLRQMVVAQADKIRELDFRLSVIDNRTRKHTGPVKLG